MAFYRKIESRPDRQFASQRLSEMGAFFFVHPYYNVERRHSALDYLAPNHFETQLENASLLCPA